MGLGRAQGSHHLEQSAEKASKTQEGWMTRRMSGGSSWRGWGLKPGTWPQSRTPRFLFCVFSTCSSSSPNRALGGADCTLVQTRWRNTLHPRVHPQMLRVSGLP